ncbi:MAG: LysR family transcriptional regulator, partial [Blautia sp.]
FGLLRNLFTDGYHWMIAPASIIRSLREVCPVWVSELANETQPPERFVYQLNHKNPNIVTLRAVELFNKNLNQYLEKENWETIKI